MLKNISVRFDPVEDRLALRLQMNTAEGEAEHCLHLTRRLCASWRQDLQLMVDMSAELPARLDQAAKAVVSAAHHQVMSSQVPVHTEPAPAQPPKAQARPVLVTKVTCGRRRKDGRWVLQFELAEKPTLALLLSTPTLHALVDAVSRRVQVASWNLPAVASERKPADRSPDAPLH